MQYGSQTDRIQHLKGLAALHGFMRDDGCRYGFIMTELELVCVRYGVDTRDATPITGFLELSDPVRMSTSSDRTKDFVIGDSRQGDLSTIPMTADLALFYLHMLAKEEPLPGQFGCWLDFEKCKVVERDSSVPKVLLHDKRKDLRRKKDASRKRSHNRKLSSQRSRT